MKFKIGMLVVLTMLLLLSILQIFNVPPYAGDILSVYKSGYFSELDKGFDVIKDSFVAIKSDARAEIAWSFLSDIEKTKGIKSEVFDYNGYRLAAPSEKTSRNEEVLNYIASGKMVPISGISAGKYYSIVPLFAEKRCLICHRKSREGNLVGLIRFERKYDSIVYYSSERVIIFVIISIILLILIFFLIKWDPEKHIKELFDKT